jgi:hypothetical protein
MKLKNLRGLKAKNTAHRRFDRYAANLTPRLGWILSAGSRSDDQAASAAGRQRTGGRGLTGGQRHLAGVARDGTSGHGFRCGLALELAEDHANTFRGVAQ